MDCGVAVIQHLLEQYTDDVLWFSVHKLTLVCALKSRVFP